MWTNSSAVPPHLRRRSQGGTSSVSEPPGHPPPMPRVARSTGEALEFGRYRLLLRQRQLLADGVPVELGARAFELLLALLEADGSLVGKNELLRRVWPDIVVSEENLKVQVFNLRRALGEDRDFIRTEFGRGYRLIASLRRTPALDGRACRRRSWSSPRPIRRCTFR
jgi:DNA-binding winged helix-turn-helix (wHTH) protein